MNIRGQISRIQSALSFKGRIIKINSYQFYSEEQKRFIKCYSLVEKKPRRNKSGDLVMRDEELLNTCSQIKVLQFMAELYKEACKADGNG